MVGYLEFWKKTTITRCGMEYILSIVEWLVKKGLQNEDTFSK